MQHPVLLLSNDKTKAGPWRVLGNSVYIRQILNSFNQSSYDLEWKRGGGVLELFDVIMQ